MTGRRLCAHDSGPPSPLFDWRGSPDTSRDRRGVGSISGGSSAAAGSVSVTQERGGFAIERPAPSARGAEATLSPQAERTALERLVQAQEEELERLAYEIHDRLAQTVVSVFQDLRTLGRLTHDSPEARRAVIRGSKALKQALREARAIMDDLSPPQLEKRGLPLLVGDMIREFERDSGCETEATLLCPERLPRQTEVVLYRILHEAIVNVQRHARATKVKVSLTCKVNGVEAEVVDNGVGFDTTAALDGRRATGLLSMRRRAEFAGGVCRLESQPGKGTRVSVQIPLFQGAET